MERRRMYYPLCMKIQDFEAIMFSFHLFSLCTSVHGRYLIFPRYLFWSFVRNLTRQLMLVLYAFPGLIPNGYFLFSHALFSYYIFISALNFIAVNIFLKVMHNFIQDSTVFAINLCSINKQISCYYIDKRNKAWLFGNLTIVDIKWRNLKLQRRSYCSIYSKEDQSRLRLMPILG